MFLYQIIPSTTSFSTSASVPYEILQGQGSLQAPRGSQHCPGTGRCSSMWSSLFREEFAGSATADSATSASGVWNPCTGEGWQELRGEWAPGAAGTPGMGQDTGNAIGWQWALHLLCQPARETCRERKLLVCSSRNSSSSFIFIHLPGATSPVLKDTELLSTEAADPGLESAFP